ncbi:erythropoietin receptor [Engraulis encrasicolus]|uniref:erythropoietin receptor n=1 Tax=Engraulis encrasicolus TaxID=184585 RepID=UPI002FCF7BE8
MTNVSQTRVLAFCTLLCISNYTFVMGSKQLQAKVNMLRQNETIQNPKCFLNGAVKIFCFWEEMEENDGAIDLYSFRYTYQNENITTYCPVNVLSSEGGKTIYSCEDIRVIFYDPLDIEVWRNKQIIHNRTLVTDRIFLLDPPSNLTLNKTAKPGQLKVTWLQPDFIDDFLLYEISYAVTGTHMGKREEVRSKTHLFLQGLQPGVRYSVRARVKPQNSFSFDGWWSAWTDPVIMEMPNETDPLVLSMSIVISLILLLLSLTILLTYRQLLLKKLWPVIPTPESKFSDLFSVYKGDFQEWMNHGHGGTRWIPAYYYTEEPVAPLEVLSEINRGPPLPNRMAAPRHRDPEAVGPLGPRQQGQQGVPEMDHGSLPVWSELQHEGWMLDRMRTLQPTPLSQSSLLESHDVYVALNQSQQKPKDKEEAGGGGGAGGGGERRDFGSGNGQEDVLEESVPLQTLFPRSGTRSSVSHSDLGSVQQSSGSGQLSSQSSFEYPNQTWPPNAPSYTYMAVADSGVSMDYYSPMSSSQLTDTERRSKPRAIYTNDYKNDLAIIHKYKPWQLLRQPTDSAC